MDLTSGVFWTALGSIILANIVLSGDNAVVIALAARSLPPHQQTKAIFWGSAAAIVMRIVLTLIAVEMLKWPYLKAIGAVLLVYIGVTLLLEDDGEGEEGHEKTSSMLAAVRTILIADLVMSLDNVIAVAAAAGGSMTLLVLGLAISIPLVVFGATLLVTLMERYPVIITIGAALIGMVAGEMLVTDPVALQWLNGTAGIVVEGGNPRLNGINLELVAGAIGAALVVIWGLWLAKRHAAAAAGTDSPNS